MLQKELHSVDGTLVTDSLPAFSGMISELKHLILGGNKINVRSLKVFNCSSKVSVCFCLNNLAKGENLHIHLLFLN